MITELFRWLGIIVAASGLFCALYVLLIEGPSSHASAILMLVCLGSNVYTIKLLTSKDH